jgi:hypothetical protein
MDPREMQVLIKKPEVVKGPLTRIQHFVAQFDRSGDINKMKVHYDSFAEIWNKADGLVC